MLKAERRIHTQEFEDLLRTTRPLHSKNLILRFFSGNRDVPEYKAAVIISKKIAKKSTDRHTFKRRIFAILSKKQIKNGSILYFFGKKGSATIPFHDLESEITDLLQKTGLIEK